VTLASGATTAAAATATAGRFLLHFLQLHEDARRIGTISRSVHQALLGNHRKLATPTHRAEIRTPEAENATLFPLVVSRVCPEPVLVKGSSLLV
jgi:hypothetical protein